MRGLAVPGLVIANAALACGPWLVRLAESESRVGPVASAFWRLALALPVMAALLLARRPAQPPSPGLLLAGGAAGLFFAGDLAAWHLGIVHTRLANASLFANITAFLFPIYGFVVARRWPGRRQVVALSLAAIGAALLLGRSYELSARYLAGDLLCLLAGLFYTLYLIALTRAGDRLAPLLALTLVVAAGAPALLVAAWIWGGPILPASWTPLLLLTLGSQLIGQGLMLFALGRTRPLVIGLMLLTQPVIGAAIGWIVYGERLAPLDLIGAGAIGIALLLVREGHKPVEGAP